MTIEEAVERLRGEVEAVTGRPVGMSEGTVLLSGTVPHPDCICVGDGICAVAREDDPEGMGWVCTRPDGHEGAHVACGYYEHYIVEWT